MGPFSACLLEVIPIIGLKGDAPTEHTFSAGNKCRLHARRTSRLRGLRQLLIAAFVAVVASCNLTYATMLQQTSGIDPATLNLASLARSREVDRQDYFMPGRYMPLLQPSLKKHESHARYRQHLPATSFAEYPKPLLGTWMPQSMGCVQAANGGMYEGEALIRITSEMLGQYENTSRPLQVEQISEKPAAWRITSAFSPGTGEYEGNKILIFTLNASTLLIDVGGHVTAYTKCEYNNN